MKILILMALCFSSFSVFSKDLEGKKELLSDLKEETKKCAVQIVATKPTADNSEVVGFKSVCTSLVIVSQAEARLYIDGEWVVATIKESTESDGGDLDDLYITNDQGKILATKTNIPAYDSVIVALVGGEHF